MADIPKREFRVLVADAIKRDATTANKVARVVWLVNQLTTKQEREQVIAALGGDHV